MNKEVRQTLLNGAWAHATVTVMCVLLFPLWAGAHEPIGAGFLALCALMHGRGCWRAIRVLRSTPRE